jgi:hypothetical protein
MESCNVDWGCMGLSQMHGPPQQRFFAISENLVIFVVIPSLNTMRTASKILICLYMRTFLGARHR